MNPLLDTDFLVKLNNDRNRTVYAHVISLDQYENPIEALEGVVTAGSISIDGESAVRRTCSLTLSAKNLNINNVYWGLTTKVKIEIGLENNIIGYQHYDKIIWFKQGIFILTDFKTTQTINNYTINLTGKDKMCLLNGDVSGNFPAPVVFDSYDDASNQECVIPEDGTYNSFLDDTIREAALQGLNSRYNTDFKYIRSVGNIVSLNYQPNNNLQGTEKITFSINPNEDDWKNLSTILTTNTDGSYTVNFGDNDILGFQVKDCSIGDRFEWVIRAKIPIALIIQEMMHQFGQEQYSNIIIRDIDPFGLEMLDNNNTEDYYLLHNGTIYTDFVSKEQLTENYCLYLDKNSQNTNNIIIDELVFRTYIEEDDISLVDILNGSTLNDNKMQISRIIKKDNSDNLEIYTVTPVLKDEVAGYGMTLLVYPEDLTASPGDSITSILDKIVNMLGSYEYFYDLNGQFVFQAKPAYLKTAWNGTIYLNEDSYVAPSELSKRVAYTFDDAALTTQYQNTPNMNNIKNDYIIWGERKNLSGNSIKFHGRYAIENIPLEYTDFNGYTWTTNKKQILINIINQKIEEANNNHYIRTYNYPEGMEKTKWWEINDWANYYQTVFGVDLSINASQMQNYSKLYLNETLPEEANIKNFGKYFNYENLNNGFTDVIVITYTDKTKTQIQSISSHGRCIHYYYQFMDLRKLGKGWSYGSNSAQPNIINVISPEKKYMLENNQIASFQWGYNPDLTTAFIYDPILPTDNSNELISYLTSLIYPDTKNENGYIRDYALLEDVDWRELIHIMADDWYAHNHEDDFEINVRKNNHWPDLNINLFPRGRTNYEQYYLDFTSIGGCWQDIYDIYRVKYDYYKQHTKLQNENTSEWNLLKQKVEPLEYYKSKYGSSINETQSFFNSNNFELEEENNYYQIIFTTNIIEEKDKIIKELSILNRYVISKNVEVNNFDSLTYYKIICLLDKKIITDNIITQNNISMFYDIITINNITSINLEYLSCLFDIYDNESYYFQNGQYKYWLKDVINNPENLTFWFDFYQADEMGIGKFAVSVIGDRPKTINDTNIKVIVYRDTPDVIYCTENEYEYYQKINALKDGYKYIIFDNEHSYIKENMSRSIRYKSVHSQADDMLYQYSYYNDTVNINAVPIYYLQPNTIISIKDELSKIIGYYVMNKINISLAYNGTMQITAIKSPEQIY